MVRKNRGHRYDAGNRHEARQRARGKAAGSARSLMRQRKVEGDYRDEAEFFEEERAAALFDAPPAFVPSAPRMVQVARVRGDNLATVRPDGVTVVASRELVKPRGEQWSDYKIRVAASSIVANTRVIKDRAERRSGREEYLAELCEYLSVKLHYTNQLIRYFGAKGQRQRKKAARDWQARLGRWQCIVVPDGVPGPLVIFRHAMRQMPKELSHADFGVFASELQDALDHFRERFPDEQGLRDQDVPKGTHQALDFGAVASDIYGFSRSFGPRLYGDAVAFLEDHWREVLAFSAELYAVSLVPPAERPAYIVARGVGAFAISGGSVEGVRGVLLQLLSMPCVVSLVTALSPSSVGEGDVPIGQHQSSLADVLLRVRAGVAPGTALNGALALGGALYALHRSRDAGVSVVGLASAVFRSVARLPRVDTAEEAVAMAVRYGPIVAAAVSAAIASGSFEPLFRGGDTSYTRFVDVQTAFELRRQGRYDPALFPDDASFLVALCDCCDEVEPAVKRGDPLAARMWKDLVAMRALVRTEMQGKLRMAPFAFAVVGESSIGKSDIMMKAVARLTFDRYGKAATNDEIYTRQQWDSYWSGYKQNKKVCVFDDVANPRAAPGTTIPNQCAAFIQVINNIPQPLNMADVESKGNVSFTSEFVVASSNLQDLGAYTYSNEPVSVLRRFNVFVVPEVREEYRKPGTYMLDPSKVPDPSVCPVPNLWRFRLLEAVKVPNALHGEVQWRPVDFPPDGTMVDLMEVLCARSRAHFDSQAKLIRAHTTRDFASMPLDQLRAMQDPPGGEMQPPVAVHQSFGVPPLVGRAARGALDGCVSVAGTVLESAQSFAADRVTDMVIESVSSRVLSLVSPAAAVGYLLVSVFLSAPLVHLLLALLLASAAVARRRAAQRLRNSRLACAMGSVSALAGLVVWLLTRDRASSARHQGLVEMVEASRGTASTLRPSDVAHEAFTRTFSQAKDSLRRRSRFAVFDAGSAMAIGVLLPLRKGLYVTSRHIVRPIVDSGASVITLAMFGHASGFSQRFQISPAQIYMPSPEHDVAFLSFAGPTERDIRGEVMPDAWYRAMRQDQTYFPVAEACVLATRVPAAVLTQGASPVGSLSSTVVRLMGAPRVRPVKFGGDIHTVIAMSPAGVPTLPGDCGSPLLLSARVGGPPATFVVGIHSGVTTVGGEDLVVVAPLYSSMVTAAEEYYATATYQSSVRLFGQPPDTRLNAARGHPLLPQGGKYVRSLGVLENDKGVNASSQNTFKSNLTRGLFYEPGPIDAILGPRLHGFPTDTRNIIHYVRPLEAMAAKHVDCDADVLAQATADFRATLRVGMGGAYPARPATLFEATNTDGVQPTLQLSTSSGFGRKGQKHNYVVPACTLACTDAACERFHPSRDDYVVPGRDNFYPDAGVLAEVAALIEALASGATDLAVFRASLKDEPVALGKEKIRAFYVAAMAFNLVVRMYLMPFMSRLQGRDGYECMVGIDPQGPAWEAMQCSLEARHPTRRLAGDYKAFDLTTNEVLLTAFYDTVYHLAEDAGWDAHALSVVRGLGRNLSRPVYIFLGQAFSVIGSNPSGVAITTHTNSGVNALIHRYAFYAKNRQLVGLPCEKSATETLFTASVRLCTYGDDVVGAVADLPGVEAISNHDVRDAAACFGMIYGPTDKGSADLPAYYEASSVEFLKRRTVYVPSLGYRVGAIALPSIRKSIAFEERGDFEKRRSTFRSALTLYFPHAAREGVEDPVGTYNALRDLLLAALASGEEDSQRALSESALPTFNDALEAAKGGQDAPRSDVLEGEFQSVDAATTTPYMA